MSRLASSLGGLPPMMPVEMPPTTTITNMSRTKGIAMMAMRSFFIGGSIPGSALGGGVGVGRRQYCTYGMGHVRFNTSVAASGILGARRD
jgi:hypothetical protein